MSKIKQKIRVRTIRSFRGHPAGTILTPLSGAARQMLLETKDALGRPIAELVEDAPDVNSSDESETPATVEDAPDVNSSVNSSARRKPGNRKAAA